MTDSYNEFSLSPTPLDAERLKAMSPDKNVVAENVTWTCCRYPRLPHKGPGWCEFTLLVTHPHIPAEIHELPTLQDVMNKLTFLENKRKGQK